MNKNGLMIDIHEASFWMIEVIRSLLYPNPFFGYKYLNPRRVNASTRFICDP